MKKYLSNPNNHSFKIKQTESYLEDAITVLEWAKKLMMQKGKDYQGGSVCDEDYYPHGWKSFDTMLTTKVLRFRSVMEQKGEVNFDSAQDCLIDLINYSARCVVFLNRHNPDSQICPNCQLSDALSYEGPEGEDFSDNPFCHECDEHVNGDSLNVKKDQGINNDRFTPDIEELPYNGA